MTPSTQPIEIRAADGYRLAATVTGGADPSTPWVVMAGATGVPASFYARFARHLAAQGIGVVTFDYRGIAGSRRGPLRGFETSFLEWATKDLAGVVDWATARGPTVVVGHSFGGHAFGLLPNANQTAGLFAFGAGAGWHGYMPAWERPRVLLLWHVVGPLLTNVVGYLPSHYLGLGEDLPLGVFQQWKKWCSHPNYFFGDDPSFAQQFAQVRVPVLAVSSTDDAWAPPRSTAVFMAGYTGCAVELRTISPGALGVERIGHLGYFRQQSAVALWDLLGQWIHARIDSGD